MKYKVAPTIMKLHSKQKVKAVDITEAEIKKSRQAMQTHMLGTLMLSTALLVKERKIDKYYCRSIVRNARRGGSYESLRFTRFKLDSVPIFLPTSARTRRNWKNSARLWGP